MDAWGINWQYLLLQLYNFVILVIISSGIGFGLLIAIRSFFPSFLSSHITDITKSQDGLHLSNDHLPSAKTYRLNRFGKALLLIPKDD